PRGTRGRAVELLRALAVRRRALARRQGVGRPERSGRADARLRGRQPRRRVLAVRNVRTKESAMALEPQVQEVINLVIKSGRPAYHTLSPKDARQLFRETRPASTPTPPEIGAVKNLTADGPGGPIPLRVYRPTGVAAATPLPAPAYLHGGGRVIGDLGTP